MTDNERKAIHAASEQAYKLHQMAQRQYDATLNKHGMPSREENRAYYLRMYLQTAHEYLESAASVAQEIAAAEREQTDGQTEGASN